MFSHEILLGNLLFLHMRIYLQKPVQHDHNETEHDSSNYGNKNGDETCMKL